MLNDGRNQPNTEVNFLLGLHYLLKTGLSIEEIRKLNPAVGYGLIRIEVLKEATDRKFQENVLAILKG